MTRLTFCYYDILPLWQSPKALLQHLTAFGSLQWGLNLLLVGTAAGWMTKEFPLVKSPVPLTTRQHIRSILTSCDMLAFITAVLTTGMQRARDVTGALYFHSVHQKAKAKYHHSHHRVGRIHSVGLTCQHFYGWKLDKTCPMFVQKNLP